MRNQKNRKNTRTRQYLRDSIICLRPWSCRDFTIIREKLQSAATVFLVSQERQQQQQQLITKDGFNILCTGFTMGYKTGQKIFPGAGPSLRSMD